MKFIEKKLEYRLKKSIENSIKDYVLDDYLYYWEKNGRGINKETLSNVMEEIMMKVKDFTFVYLDAVWSKRLR